MSKTSLASAITLAALGTGLTLPGLAQADFLKDSKASVELRNFYFNRDFRQPGASQKRPRSGPRGSCCATSPGLPKAPSASASTPSACWGSSSIPARIAAAPACSSATARASAPRTNTANSA